MPTFAQSEPRLFGACRTSRAGPKIFRETPKGRPRSVHGISTTTPTVSLQQRTTHREAVLASRYLWEVRGRSHVITTGGSYGAAAALTNTALYPEHFDGVVAVAGPYNGRQFLSWNDANGLRSMGAGLETRDYLYYSALDGMTMAAAQAGLTLDNLDLTVLGNARVPASIILGEVRRGVGSRELCPADS